ncbi:MAG: pilus assembly protein [Bacilli bacterium]|nr:pilus assembly protein [Bacilli bacterium]
MKDKGQALVEFVLILPIILLVLIALIDIGNIFMEKYQLNDHLSTIAEMYHNNEITEAKAYAANESIIVSESVNNDMLTLKATKKVKVSAPIIKNILGKSFDITCSQTIYNETGENFEQ